MKVKVNEKNIKVGSKVYIDPNSKYKIQAEKSTHGIIQEIVEATQDNSYHNISVHWSNGGGNTYRYIDLLIDDKTVEDIIQSLNNLEQNKKKLMLKLQGL